MNNLVRLVVLAFGVAFLARAAAAMVPGLGRALGTSVGIGAEVMLRAALGLGLATGVGLGADALDVNGGLAAAAALPFAMVAVWRWRGPLAVRARILAKLRASVPVTAGAVAHWPVADAPLADAWNRLARKLAPARGARAPLDRAGVDCAALLTLADNMAADPAHYDLAVAEHAALIRRHVPALAADLAGAGAGKAELAQPAAAALTRLGERAAELLRERADRAAAMADARIRHLNNRMDDGKLEAGQ